MKGLFTEHCVMDTITLTYINFVCNFVNVATNLKVISGLLYKADPPIRQPFYVLHNMHTMNKMASGQVGAGIYIRNYRALIIIYMLCIHVYMFNYNTVKPCLKWEQKKE